MIGSRRDESEDDVLEELEEEELSSAGDEKKPLSLSERRALRKAKRAGGLNEADDEDDEDSSAVARTAPKQAPTRSQEDALKARGRETQRFGENIPLLGRFITYLRDVAAEMKKVTWPTREEARRLTVIVLGVTASFSAVLGAIDVFYGWWFKQGITNTGGFLIVAAIFFSIGGFLSWRYILSEEV